jgi:hypothetical protein
VTVPVSEYLSRAVSSWQSFRLAENTDKSAFSRALPLLTPCGMIAPKISEAAGNVA